MSMPSIDTVLSQLKAGNERYVNDQVTAEGRDSTRRAELTTGQAPWAIVLSCADSRVAPEVLFDTGLGELFVVRVAGNVANTSSIDSIEYAVAHIGTPVIVVLGHQACGAVGAALAGGDNGYNLNHLLAHIAPAIAESDEKTSDAVVTTNAQLTANDLVERSAIIRDAVAGGKLRIVPAVYSLDTGTVTYH